MDLDRFIGFTILAKYLAESEVRIDCFPVSLDKFDKDIQRLTLLVIEQIIETLEIFSREMASAGRFVPVAPECHPEKNDNDGQG